MNMAKLWLPLATLLIGVTPLSYNFRTWAQESSPACSSDSDACTTSCINSGLMSNPVLDCRRSCGQFNSDYNGYCYARPYANTGLSSAERKAIYLREAQTCTASECDPRFHQQLQTCSNMDRAAKIACGTSTVNENLRCAAACNTRALQKAQEAR